MMQALGQLIHSSIMRLNYFNIENYEAEKYDEFLKTVMAFIGLVIVYFYWKKKDSGGCKGKLGGNEKRKSCGIIPCAGEFQNNDSEVETEKGSPRAEGDLVAIDKGFDFELDELLRASAYVLGKSKLGIVYKVVVGEE